MSVEPILQTPHESATLFRGTLVRRWLIDLLGSWCIVWFAAPLALNSILVRDKIPELKSIGLRTGDTVRWRSEGWATTQIGKYGLSGYHPVTDVPVIAIYGDSQVEGHCVNDADKICNQVSRIAEQRVGKAWDCVPLARSGADAKVWKHWLQQAEVLWQPRWHLWIVTELSDLTIDESDQPMTHDIWAAPSPNWIRLASDWQAESLFTIARRLAWDSSTGQSRQLRFTLGKVSLASKPIESPDATEKVAEHVPAKTIQQLQSLNAQLQGRLVILYSPAVPTVHPAVRFDAPDPMWDDLKIQIGDSVQLIDLRPEYARLWQEKRQMPRGFHNGQPYSGHLNSAGNAVIAQVIVERLMTDLPTTID